MTSTPNSPVPAAGEGAPPVAPPSGSGRPDDVELLAIRGELSYRVRMALPPGAQSAVELRTDAEAPPLASQRLSLDGRQVPVPFLLQVDRARWAAAGELTLKGAILVDGQAQWETEAVPIPSPPAPVDLGILWLRPVQGATAAAPAPTRGGPMGATLTGGEWWVERIADAAILGGAKASLSFGSDNRLSGRGPCNGFGGRYVAVTDGALGIDDLYSTMKACEPAVMAEEARLLEALKAVRRYEIGADGALALIDAQGRRTIARRG